MTRSELRKLIEATADETGLVTPEGIVAAAEDPENPLHQHRRFLWGSDKEAAYEHRLRIANELIRRVWITTRLVEKRAAKIPVFVRAPRGEENLRGHVKLDSVEPSSDDASLVVNDELRRVIGALKRASVIAAKLHVDGIDGQIAELLRDAQTVQAQLGVPQTVAT